MSPDFVTKFSNTSSSKPLGLPTGALYRDATRRKESPGAAHTHTHTQPASQYKQETCCVYRCYSKQQTNSLISLDTKTCLAHTSPANNLLHCKQWVYIPGHFSFKSPFTTCILVLVSCYHITQRCILVSVASTFTRLACRSSSHIPV